MARPTTIPFSRWKDYLQASGFIVEEDLAADGAYHRLSTVDKPHKKNVSYKIITLDKDFKVLYLTDFANRSNNLILLSAHVSPSSKIRKELDKAVEQMEEDEKRDRQEAIDRDCKQCREAPQATDDNPYLKKKGVHAVVGLLQGTDEELIIPLKNVHGTHYGSQRIARDGSKTFAKDCDYSGAFFTVEGTTDLVGFAEGLATALSVHEAIGCTVIVCCGSNNLSTVASEVENKYSSSRFVFFADNDIDNNKGNIGIIKAREAAQLVGASVIYPHSPDGQAIDWNDLYTTCGPDEVIKQITAGLKQGQLTKIPAGFEMREWADQPGLYISGDPKREPTWIGAPLYVASFARTESSARWCRLLQWKDHDGVPHRTLLNSDTLSRDPAAVFSMLDGYLYDVNRKNDIMRYLSVSEPTNRLILAEQAGWTRGYSAYVLPEKAFLSDSCTERFTLANAPSTPVYSSAGSFEEWKKLMRLTIGNHLLTLGIVAAFTGPLLRLSGVEFLCYQFTGLSSCGKTTILQAAASVCGQYSQYTQSWRATDNGLEGICKQKNDGLLILDEQSEADGKSIQESSYMIANGHGKRRAKTDGEAREISRWILTALSSGEVSIDERTVEGGRTPHAGQEVRWINLPVTLEDVRELHGLSSSQELIDTLKEGCLQHYGHAWDKFLEKLVNKASSLSAQLRSEIKAVAKELTDQCPGCSGQVHRVAARFALCEITGSLVSQWGILPHSLEDVKTSVRACFKKWIEHRGTIDEDEVTIAARRILGFINQYDSRFESACVHSTRDSLVIHNIAGYRLQTEEGYRVYAILRNVFCGEVLGGDPNRRPNLALLRKLRDNGLIVQEKTNGKDRFVTSIVTPRGTKAQVYKVRLKLDPSHDKFARWNNCSSIEAVSELDPEFDSDFETVELGFIF